MALDRKMRGLVSKVKNRVKHETKGIEKVTPQSVRGAIAGAKQAIKKRITKPKPSIGPAKLVAPPGKVGPAKPPKKPPTPYKQKKQPTPYKQNESPGPVKMPNRPPSRRRPLTEQELRRRTQSI